MTQGAICYGCRYYGGSKECKLGREIQDEMEYCEDKQIYVPLIKVDNAYKHYLEDGEQPRKGEVVHIGPRKGKYVMREEQGSLLYTNMEINDVRHGGGNVKVADGDAADIEKLNEILYNSYINISLTDDKGRSIAAVSLQPDEDLVILDNIASVKGKEAKREALLHMFDYCKTMGYDKIMFSPKWGDNFTEEDIELISSFPHTSSEGVKGFDWAGFVVLTPPDEYKTELFQEDPLNPFRISPNQIFALSNVNGYLDWNRPDRYKYYSLPKGYLLKHANTLFGRMPKVRGIETRGAVVAHSGDKIYFDEEEGYQGLEYPILQRKLYERGNKTLDLSLSIALTVAALRNLEEEEHCGPRSPVPETIASEQMNAAKWIFTLTGSKEDKQHFFREFADADDKAEYITGRIWDRYGHLFNYDEIHRKNLYNSLWGEQLDDNFDPLPKKSEHKWNQSPEMKEIYKNVYDIREITPILFDKRKGAKQYSFGSMLPVKLDRAYYTNRALLIQSPLLHLVSKEESFTIDYSNEGEIDPIDNPTALSVGLDFETLPRSEQEKRIYSAIGRRYWNYQDKIPHHLKSGMVTEFKNVDDFAEMFALYAVTRGREEIDGESFENQKQFAVLDRLLTYTTGSPPTQRIRSYLPSDKAEGVRKYLLEESEKRFNREAVQQMADKDHEYLVSLEPKFQELMRKLERKSNLEELMEQGKIPEGEYFNSKELKEFNEAVEEYQSLMKEETLSVERRRFKDDIMQKIAGIDGINQNFNPDRVVSFEVHENRPDELAYHTLVEDYTPKNVKLTEDATRSFEEWAKTHLRTDLMADLEVHVGIATEGDRSFCKDGGGNEQWIALSLSAVDRMKTLAHEFGHAIEHSHIPIFRAAHRFLRARTYGEEEIPLGDGFRSDEKCKRDKFPDAYCGKIYAQATEIISMGLQYMYCSPDTFAEDDPEYFMFMVDVLMGNIS